MSEPFRVVEAFWPKDQTKLAAVRETVFIQEQKVPIELEWDGLDAEARHFIALDKARHPIGTARLLADGHVGRMAVLIEWRRRGVGSALLKAVMSATQQTLFLHAQVDAIPFYQRFGFVAEGPEFMDAGIPHRKMVLSRNR